MKRYEHDGKIYELRPLSAWDVLELPDLIGAAMREIPPGVEPTPDVIAVALRGSAKIMICRQLGIQPEALRDIPAPLFAAMVADFLEMNLTENFLSDLSRLCVGAGRVRRWWSSLSARSATPGPKSADTPSGASARYSTPAPPSIPRRRPGSVDDAARAATAPEGAVA